MKLRVIVIPLSLFLMSSQSIAAVSHCPQGQKMTLKCALKDDKAYRDSQPNTTNAEIIQMWNNNVRVVTESSPILKVTTSTYSARNGTTRLKPTNGYICTVGKAGGYYRRGLKGIEVNVYQSGGYWYLKAKHDSGGSDNWGSATCWNTK
ncbi:hypothetical protein C9J12_21225 [Photobacterium frigidiphilum]|uniref:Ig-like domain-containing protein n=1 Tax=Photobacterium frigidiphilum TaxID=264736 RepID=A0A2T3JAF0_9GAMM|nr:hypothetical protein [Photobacterium frigidiphilum]PSU45764.1 hypothetical protein C9J12_21225 [Photobacterium frigidiphilum]